MAKRVYITKYIKEFSKKESHYIGNIEDSDKEIEVYFNFPEPFTGIGWFEFNESDIKVVNGTYKLYDIKLPKPENHGYFKIYRNTCSCDNCRGYEVKGAQYNTYGLKPSSFFYSHKDCILVSLKDGENILERGDYLDVFKGNTSSTVVGSIIYEEKDFMINCCKSMKMDYDIKICSVRKYL